MVFVPLLVDVFLILAELTASFVRFPAFLVAMLASFAFERFLTLIERNAEFSSFPFLPMAQLVHEALPLLAHFPLGHSPAHNSEPFM